MTRVKICGIKDQATLRTLAEIGADYAGFVFADSRRRVTPQEAGAILRAVPDRPLAVGVFVNPSLAELQQTLEAAPLDVIQLHGKESADFCAEVAAQFGKPVWKAVAVQEDGAMKKRLAAYRPHVEAFLFDTHDPRQAGGTGRRFAWSLIPQLAEMAGDTPFFIAGGIHPDNVGELLTHYRPPAIDVSSGVETDGVKDHGKIRDLMKRVREHDPNHASATGRA